MSVVCISDVCVSNVKSTIVTLLFLGGAAMVCIAISMILFGSSEAKERASLLGILGAGMALISAQLVKIH